MDQKHPYESVTPFGQAHVDTLCVYCSDGRFVAQTDEFMRELLGVTAYDRLVVPGGCASIAGHAEVWRDGEVISESIRFLQRAHDLRRVVLVAHEDCGYYARKLGLGATDMEVRQLQDLQEAAGRIRGFATAVEVPTFFARRTGGKVCFEPVSF